MRSYAIVQLFRLRAADKKANLKRVLKSLKEFKFRTAANNPASETNALKSANIRPMF